MLVGLVSSNNLNAIETHELAPFYEDEGDPLSRATQDGFLRQSFALVSLDVDL